MSNGEGSGLGTVVPGSLIGYKGNLYCLATSATKVKLIKHIYGTSVTSVGDIGDLPTNGITPQMFVHPKDNRLYMAGGFSMGSFDGTTLSTRDFSTNHNITAICPYGSNIMIGMVSKEGNGSVAGVWNGSITSSELIDVVNFGSDTLLILENIGDVVVGVSGVSVGGSSDVGVQNTVTIRSYAGGSAQIVQRLESIGSLGSRVYPLKAKRNDSLYFPMAVYLNGTRIHQIWTIYKNDLGVLVVAPDRKCNNDTELLTEFIIGLSLIGDYMWTAFSSTSTTGSFFRTNDQAVFTSTSSFETLVNDGMDRADRSAKKQIKAISLRCGSPTGASYTVTISYKADGGAYRTIYTGTSSAVVRVIEEVGETDGKNFLEGKEYIFKVETTGNGEIYEFKYGYEVIKTNI